MYFSDDKVTFSLVGLRWIKKVDSTFLELQYKGSQVTVKYDRRKDRDRVYESVAQYLNANNRLITSVVCSDGLKREEIDE